MPNDITLKSPADDERGILYTPTLDHWATLGTNATRNDIGSQIKRYYSRGKAIPLTRSNYIANEVKMVPQTRSYDIGIDLKNSGMSTFFFLIRLV